MGGPGAPDDLNLAPVTQAWLAVSADPSAMVTGRHFYHQREQSIPEEARSTAAQDALFDYCAGLTGVSLTGGPSDGLLQPSPISILGIAASGCPSTRMAAPATPRVVAVLLVPVMAVSAVQAVAPLPQAAWPRPRSRCRSPSS